MSLNTWFTKGLTAQEYIEKMNVNKEEMNTIYQKFSLDEDDVSILESIRNQSLRVIVLSEDWCGDAMLNNPILLKIAEEAGMDVRFLLRDSNLELMDQYLTNGTSRAIPIFIFFDQAGNEKAVWGPRAPKIQQLVERLRKSLPDKEHPDFKAKQSEMIQTLTASYKEDESLWKEVSYSIITTLKKKRLHV
ncbi:thioredoxin family protein [Bacillus sp. CMF21]|nr:thioredoxin family protein [Bacillus sp. CMF21]